MVVALALSEASVGVGPGWTLSRSCSFATGFEVASYSAISASRSDCSAQASLVTVAAGPACLASKASRIKETAAPDFITIASGCASA